MKLRAPSLALALAVTVPHAALAGAATKTVTVEGRNDDAIDTGVGVEPGDVVLVSAQGSVKLGDWVGSSGPWGRVGTEAEKGKKIAIGTLVMKTGSGPAVAVGERAFRTIEEGGSIKLKVHDTGYENNSGSYDVSLLVIPRAELPEPLEVKGDAEPPKIASSVAIVRLGVTVEGTNDEWTNTGVAIAPGDWVAFSATGTVKGATANGGDLMRSPSSRHALIYKLGTGAASFAGERGAFVAASNGTLKLKVQETDHAKADGRFLVDVIIFRANVGPAAETPQAIGAATEKDQILKVSGTFVSSADNGVGQSITIKTASGKMVTVMANYPRSQDATMSWPPSPPLTAGAPLTVVYKAHTLYRVSAVRPLGKDPGWPGAVTGEFVEVAQGDLGAYVLVKRNGKQESLVANFDVLTKKQAAELKGQRVELKQEPETHAYYISHQLQ